MEESLLMSHLASCGGVEVELKEDNRSDQSLRGEVHRGLQPPRASTEEQS
jgi:hypothetical protein